MRVIHILDHSVPLATPYAAHTLCILRAQRAQGWETFQLTGPNQGAGAATEEDVDGWRFYRTPRPGGLLERVPGVSVLEFMGEIAHRIERLARRVRPHVLHAHAPVLNAIPALRVGWRLDIPVVYELRAPGDGLVQPALPPRVARALETWAMKRAAAITTASQALKSDLVLRGFATQKVVVIPCDRHPVHGAPAGNAGPGLGSAETYGGLYEHLLGAS